MNGPGSTISLHFSRKPTTEQIKPHNNRTSPNRIQPNEKTRNVQLQTWADLVINYQRHHGQPLLVLNESTPLFANGDIGRTLQPDGRLAVLEHLEGRRNAAPCDKARQQWEIYWLPLDECAQLLHRWATDNGQTNAVCTFFELTEGDAAVGQPWQGIGVAVLRKALAVLEAQGKCELMGDGDDGGVKFY